MTEEEIKALTPGEWYLTENRQGRPFCVMHCEYEGDSWWPHHAPYALAIKGIKDSRLMEFYVWPDGTTISTDEDIDEFMRAAGMSDDYKVVHSTSEESASSQR